MFKKFFKKRKESEEEDKYEYETIDEPFNKHLETCMKGVFENAKKLYQKIVLIDKKNNCWTDHKRVINDIKILASFDQHNIYRSVFKKMDKTTAKDFHEIKELLRYLSADIYRLERDRPRDFSPVEYANLRSSLSKASDCLQLVLLNKDY